MISEELSEYLNKNGINFPIRSTIIKLKRGEKISKTGDIEKNIYFLISGKIVAELENGSILDFIFPGSLFTSLSSLLAQSPMDITHKCLSKCTVEVIPFKSIQEACDTSISANKFLIHFLTFYYLDRVKKEKDRASKNVEERYQDIIKNRPELLWEISSSKLALYLKIHPNSLSRLKRKWLSKSKAKK